MPSSSERRRARSIGESVIVFDLDDTLYLERDYVLSGLTATGVWARNALGIDGLGPVMCALFRSGQRTRIFDDGLRALGHAARPELIARMLITYRQHHPRIALADDAAAFLQHHQADAHFAVITDGFLDAQKRKIRALGLHRLGLRLGICTDRWGRDCWKPNPRAFDYVEAVFGLSGLACTYVADNPAKDFIAPKRLGWRTVRINRKEKIVHLSDTQSVDADRVIENFGQF